MSSRIFGLCENPVSTIDKAIRIGGEFVVPTPVFKELPKVNQSVRMANFKESDVFVSDKKNVTSNPILKMRNGFGKLMKHFSKSLNK